MLCLNSNLQTCQAWPSFVPQRGGAEPAFFSLDQTDYEKFPRHQSCCCWFQMPASMMEQGASAICKDQEGNVAEHTQTECKAFLLNFSSESTGASSDGSICLHGRRCSGTCGRSCRQPHRRSAACIMLHCRRYINTKWGPCQRGFFH